MYCTSGLFSADEAAISGFIFALFENKLKIISKNIW
jgi:hypothetical protein